MDPTCGPASNAGGRGNGAGSRTCSPLCGCVECKSPRRVGNRLPRLSARRINGPSCFSSQACCKFCQAGCQGAAPSPAGPSLQSMVVLCLCTAPCCQPPRTCSTTGLGARKRRVTSPPGRSAVVRAAAAVWAGRSWCAPSPSASRRVCSSSRSPAADAVHPQRAFSAASRVRLCSHSLKLQQGVGWSVSGARHNHHGCTANLQAAPHCSMPCQHAPNPALAHTPVHCSPGDVSILPSNVHAFVISVQHMQRSARDGGLQAGPGTPQTACIKVLRRPAVPTLMQAAASTESCTCARISIPRTWPQP